MEKIISELFHKLHNNPECSGKELKTRELIKDFMNKNTSMEYRELPGGFYYVYKSLKGYKNIAIRADYDAVTVDNDCAKHLCGHDGHSSSLCALALMLEKFGSDNNVYLLFQSAEENGQGAKQCLGIFDNNIDEIYGQHNLPGFKFGEAYTIKDTFACTSCGLIIKLKGKGSHAAYPELGLSPSKIIYETLSLVEKYKTLEKMVTVIGVKMGDKTFGVMAHDGEIYLTLRSNSDYKLKELEKEIIEYIDKTKGEIEFTYEEIDYFPATINHEKEYNEIINKLNAKELNEPMRWSEDFGYYLQEHEGAFFGVGAGTNYPGLHTSEYEYPIELIDITAEYFYNLVK
ncbi:MAG: M20/M25/M40 family metallo-hydrolase [Erysipelotrichaceae bacterium]|nr:M20/M25/M40 family metallo-hydrolase [Erysipelotrichaceae bacterium]